MQLINLLRLFLFITVVTFYSCDNEPYEDFSAINTVNSTSKGLKINEKTAKKVALNFYNRSYTTKDAFTNKKT